MRLNSFCKNRAVLHSFRQLQNNLEPQAVGATHQTKPRDVDEAAVGTAADPPQKDGSALSESSWRIYSYMNMERMHAARKTGRLPGRTSLQEFHG